MANEREEDAEYVSDPEEAMLPLAMRRREASDDEEEDGEERDKQPRVDLRTGIGSDYESDDQGGVPAYDDEESEIEEYGEEVEEVGEVEEEEEFEVRVGEGGDDNGQFEVPVVVSEFVEGRRSVVETADFHGNDQVEEEKKEKEPFAVPTAGAFYMHDDRLRNNGGGRHRRTPAGRNLWESKDDRKWGHDKFEEMTLHDTHYDKGRRSSKSYYQGRGKNRAMDRGYARGNRSRVYDENNDQNRNKVVRGRRSRRYEPPPNNNSEVPPTQNKQSGKSIEALSNTSSGRVPTHTSHVQADPVPPPKHVFASSLSVASPPFYPSGSSNQNVSVTQKRDVQDGITNRNLSHSNMLLQGKNVSDPIGQDKMFIGESVHQVARKPLTNMHMHASGPSPIKTNQSPPSKAHGKGSTISGQPTLSLNQVNRVSAQKQLPAIQQRPVQIPLQHLSGASVLQLGQHPGRGSQASPPKAESTNSAEHGDMESPQGSSKSKMAVASKGNGIVQGSGRGTFLYRGAQVIGATGAMNVAHGDQNFSATPALLQVMQFGSQHSGGVGVPAVGMALPGYVAQPHLGFGNSEMAWVPVLAGAAGALGATYCLPYGAVDGGYYARPSGQTSSLGVSSKETTTNKPSNVLKSLRRPELVNDEFGRRQNKPRRYSEMNFGQ